MSLDVKYIIYMQLEDRVRRVELARLRSSAHGLNIEQGRYKKRTLSGNNKFHQVCRYCSPSDNKIILNDLQHLPFFDPVLETECHALSVCPGYHHLRVQLSDSLKTHLMLHQFNYIMATPILVYELGLFLTKCSKVRINRWSYINTYNYMDSLCI